MSTPTVPTLRTPPGDWERGQGWVKEEVAGAEVPAPRHLSLPRAGCPSLLPRSRGLVLVTG